MPEPLSSPEREVRSITALIAVYNGAKHVGAAIESILGQTRPADEVLVIDDGSTDDTAALARSYPGVRVISKPNGGVAAARNLGIREATSEWIAFLDHDDVWRPEKLALQVKAIEDSGGADLCVCRIRGFFDAEAHSYGQGDSTLDLPPSHRMASELKGNLRFPPSAVLARRSKLLEAGGFDASAQPCEDWDLWLKLARTAKLVRCNATLLDYRRHEGNVSNKSYLMMDGELRAYDRHVRPTVPALVRPLHRRFARARFLAGVAVVEREQGRPHLGAMLKSLLLCPVGDWRRHKIAAHMMLKRAGVVR